MGRHSTRLWRLTGVGQLLHRPSANTVSCKRDRAIKDTLFKVRQKENRERERKREIEREMSYGRRRMHMVKGWRERGNKIKWQEGEER